MIKIKKSIKITLIAILCLIITLSTIFGVSFAVLSIKSNAINDDFSVIYANKKYEKSVSIENIEIITQSISCGYAVIEMFSSWSGGNITEEFLYNQYGKVVTSMGNSFCNEFNKQFPEYNTKIYKYLRNTELIDMVYNSIADGIPVPFEWAALNGDEWTLHYSLVIGLDIKNDIVSVANPYGYLENISIKNFLDRTSFRAFEKMPFFYQTAFAFGIFEKNTIFIATKVNQ